MTSPMLQLDADGDLDFSEGGLRSRPNVRQRIETRLRFFLGEWFLDTTKGTPYFQQIFGKGRNVGQVAAIFRRRILETEGVLEITEFSVEFDTARRKFSVRFRALYDDSQTGELVEIQV